VPSDNGKNFAGANQELQELIMSLEQHKIIMTPVSHSLKWNFRGPVCQIP